MRDETTIRQIMADYPNSVLILKFQPYFTEESLRTTFERQGRTLEEYEERKHTWYNPTTEWANGLKSNFRIILNPMLLKNISASESDDFLCTRLENILEGECKCNLGSSFKTGEARGLYSYFYYMSKRRPSDSQPIELIKIPNNTMKF